MRRIKLAITLLLSTVILTSIMAIAGCDEDHHEHWRGHGDHHPEYRHHEGDHDRH